MSQSTAFQTDPRDEKQHKTNNIRTVRPFERPDGDFGYKNTRRVPRPTPLDHHGPGQEPHRRYQRSESQGPVQRFPSSINLPREERHLESWVHKNEFRDWTRFVILNARSLRGPGLVGLWHGPVPPPGWR